MWSMLEDFVYFKNKAFSSLSLCFTLGFRFKFTKNLFNKMRNKSPQTLFFSQPLPLLCKTVNPEQYAQT